jgi:hypothetical protein
MVIAVLGTATPWCWKLREYGAQQRPRVVPFALRPTPDIVVQYRGAHPEHSYTT